MVEGRAGDAEMTAHPWAPSSPDVRQPAQPSSHFLPEAIAGKGFAAAQQGERDQDEDGWWESGVRARTGHLIHVQIPMTLSAPFKHT